MRGGGGERGRGERDEERGRYLRKIKNRIVFFFEDTASEELRKEIRQGRLHTMSVVKRTRWKGRLTYF